jgi:hypothetical protein
MSKELRLAFWDKKAEIEAVEANIQPLRAEYDKMTQDYHLAIQPVIEQLKVEEAPLFELKNELGAMVRELSGNTALQPGDKE